MEKVNEIRGKIEIIQAEINHAFTEIGLVSEKHPFEYTPEIDLEAIQQERLNLIESTKEIPSLVERVALLEEINNKLIYAIAGEAIRFAEYVEQRDEKIHQEQMAILNTVEQKRSSIEVLSAEIDIELFEQEKERQKLVESNGETPVEKDGLIDHLLLAGFGEAKKKQLADAGVKMWSDLAQLTAAEVNGMIKPDAASKRVQEWIDFAKNRLA